MWTEFSTSISRTTNACESFHSKLNDMFFHSYRNIYQLLETLNKVQSGSYIKMNCFIVRYMKR